VITADLNYVMGFLSECPQFETARLVREKKKEMNKRMVNTYFIRRGFKNVKRMRQNGSCMSMIFPV